MQLLVTHLIMGIVVFILVFVVISSSRIWYLTSVSPKLLNLEEQLRTNEYERAMKVGDREQLRRLLAHEPWISRLPFQGFGWLLESEWFLVQELERIFKRYLTLLPDDLQRFFSSFKLHWDIDNLLVIIRSIDTNVPADDIAPWLGPVGDLSYEVLLELIDQKTLADALVEAQRILPLDYVKHLAVSSEDSLFEIESQLIHAKWLYLAEQVESLSSSTVTRAWHRALQLAELDNLQLVFRLKRWEVPPEEIKKYLIPFRSRLSDHDMDRILATHDLEKAFKLVVEALTSRVFKPTSQPPTTDSILLFLETYHLGEKRKAYEDWTLTSVIDLFFVIQRSFKMKREALFTAYMQFEEERS